MDLARKFFFPTSACLSPVLAIVHAQNSSAPPPVTFTAEQDHQNMMDQLGIKALRPGPSGNEKAPNHANYDESLANPYPDIPDPLTLNNGQKVTTSKLWWDKRGRRSWKCSRSMCTGASRPPCPR